MTFVKYRCPPWTCCVTTGTAGVIMTLGWSSSFGVASAATGAVGGKVSAATAFGAATIGAAGSRDPIAEGIHAKTQNSLCVNVFFFRTKLTFKNLWMPGEFHNVPMNCPSPAEAAGMVSIGTAVGMTSMGTAAGSTDPPATAVGMVSIGTAVGMTSTGTAAGSPDPAPCVSADHFQNTH